MWKRLCTSVYCGLTLATLAALPVQTHGTTAAEFYRGKTIELIVGYGPGGGFDTYARILAPHLERRLGATVVVKNKPGGGGLTALNQLVNAEPDGLSIMLLHGEAAVLAQLVDKPGARFDLMKVNWLGRVNSETYMLLVNPKSPYQSLDDLVAASEPIKFAASGKTGGMGDMASIACEALNIHCKLITGYKGSKEASLSAIRGETDAITVTESTSRKLTEGGKMTALAALDRDRAPLFPDVPAVFEQATLSDERAWWLDFRNRIRRVGRTLVAAPGVPAERVAFLRESIEVVLLDPAVQSEAKRLNRLIRYEAPDETAKFVQAVLGSIDSDKRREIQSVLLNRY